MNNIVFDLGGVLIDWNPQYLYRKIFAKEADIQQFLEQVCHQEWNAQQDAGNSLAEATEERIRKFPHLEDEIRAYYERWTEMLGGAVEPTVEILEEFVKDPNYRVFALTNWSHETYPLAQEIFPFLGWFEGVIVSGEEKIKKPDPRLYQILCERFSIAPQDTIFIDDSQANVTVAEELGFKTIHFRAPEQLRSELSNLLP